MDRKMRETIDAIFINALRIFNVHIALAKGILVNHSNQPMDRYKALPKEKNENDLPIRKIATFLNIDLEHEMSNSNFTTDSKMLENTIKIFMDDVVRMQKELEKFEQNRAERDAMEQKKSREEKGDKIEYFISNTEQRRNKSLNIKC